MAAKRIRIAVQQNGSTIAHTHISMSGSLSLSPWLCFSLSLALFEPIDAFCQTRDLTMGARRFDPQAPCFHQEAWEHLFNWNRNHPIHCPLAAAGASACPASPWATPRTLVASVCPARPWNAFQHASPTCDALSTRRSGRERLPCKPVGHTKNLGRERLPCDLKETASDSYRQNATQCPFAA